MQERAVPRAVAGPKRIVYPLMTKVKEEIDRMLTLGIIEVVDLTEWVSPMVPVLRKTERYVFV